ncbi:hypothetical protein [Thalassospira sp. MCCC 1A01428]|jgi:hypothetical protein|uniref:hypothetical protein n=1 Tax=Thalassospira sp. MCCC 1A01428 TaxID=1470575 RepID=UPI000A1F006D|nr:hypothetical protein [Thalassospira sp. MCCC 1A01428]
MSRRKDDGTLDLFTDWTPPKIAVRFEDEARVRANSVAERVSRMVAEVLRDAEMSRADIAGAMGEFLGKPVSKAMLDAYAGQARGDHNISLARAVALVAATKDARVIGSELEPLGLAVVPRRDLHGLRHLAWQERSRKAQAMADAEYQMWKGLA